MPNFEPRDPDYAAKVRQSYTRQKVMELIGARLLRVEPGRVEIELPYRGDLVQQHGFIHAGVVATVADSAGGYAAFTLMPPGASVLSVEFKIHMLEPADGERLIAEGRVVRAGRTLTVCEMEVTAEKDGARKTCAWGTQTLICVQDRPLGTGGPG